MNEAEIDRIERIFAEAIDCTPDERDEVLDRTCGGDSSLRAQVESMLEGHSRAVEAEFMRVTGGEPGPGERIGRYRIERVIASGGMGILYVATQDDPQREVALKLLRSGIASRSALRRFRFEAQVLGRLRHPNIAQVFEAGTHDDGRGGVPYFAMEFVPEASPITEFAAAREMGTRQRLALFMKVCEAVHYGHQRGIIHRDLKPSNILVGASGEPKIIDFGVARATDSDVGVTTIQTDVGQLIGTLQYMSPEQFEADPLDLDIRSDVYALGVVLYELLTGSVPYDLRGARIDEAAQVIREDVPPRPSTIDRALKGDVETIVLTALEKDRQRRYQSVADLGADIGRYLTSQPIAARPASAIYQLRTFARRNKTLVGGLAATLIVLVLGVIGTSMGLMWAVSAQAEVSKKADRLTELVAFLESQIMHLDAMLMHRVGPQVVERELPHVRKVVEERERLMGPRDPSTISAMLLLGRRLDRAGRPAEAEQVLARALSNARGVLAEEDLGMVLLLASRGAVLRRLGRLDEAAQIGEESVRRLRMHYSRRDTEWLPWTTLYSHGSTLIDLERFEEAEQVLLESYVVRETMIGGSAEPSEPTRRLVLLYAAWHEKEPDAGYDALAAVWRAWLRGGDDPPPLPTWKSPGASRFLRARRPNQ